MTEEVKPLLQFRTIVRMCDDTSSSCDVKYTYQPNLQTMERGPYSTISPEEMRQIRKKEIEDILRGETMNTVGWELIAALKWCNKSEKPLGAHSARRSLNLGDTEKKRFVRWIKVLVAGLCDIILDANPRLNDCTHSTLQDLCHHIVLLGKSSYESVKQDPTLALFFHEYNEVQKGAAHFTDI